MIRNHTASPTSFHLRRAHHRHQEYPLHQSAFTFDGSGPKCDGNLDLSMHLPARKTNNRFELLAGPPTPPPEREPAREIYIPTRYRRSRNSRGTKEAKRRRDARRGQRKMAAYMLDEQLSRDIDTTLAVINAKINSTSPPVSTGRSTPPSISKTRVLAPRVSPQLPPTPPQLPMLDFQHDFSVNTFPELAHIRRTPSRPITMPQMSLPSWCPVTPFLARESVWSDGLPNFFDLSSLPEPKQTMNKLPAVQFSLPTTKQTLETAPLVQGLSTLPEAKRTPKAAAPKCQELQLWRSTPKVQPKISRFFPRLPTPTPVKPRVKLPPTRCKLHILEEGLPDLIHAPPPPYTEAVKPKAFVQSLEEIVQTYKDPTAPAELSLVLEPSAANLWHILSGQEKAPHHASEDTYLASFTPSLDDHDEVHSATRQTAVEIHAHAKAIDSKQEAPYLEGVRSNLERNNDNGGTSHRAAWQRNVVSHDNAIALEDPHSMHGHKREAKQVTGFKPTLVFDDINTDYRTQWRTFIDTYEHRNLPAELDGKELPYIHANCLTGAANEVALSPYAAEHPSLVDSAISFTPMPSPPVGLNELMMDYDMGSPRHARDIHSDDVYVEGISSADASLEDYAPLSSANEFCNIADILPVNCIGEDGGEAALTKSDAQFHSEQDLFSLPPLPASPADSIIDVAAFLKMGHVKSCWCSECEDVPELVVNEKLTEAEDEWMIYSAPDDSSTATQGSTEIGDDEKQTARIQCRTSEWDDFAPFTPRSTWRAGLKNKADDRFGFVCGNDWEWEWDY
ncbi:hypothetical protein LTR08_008621 [Meristemomyces frigidus]|nr:hypothetical protein LTR08_008621 [Meristemomyces frigidus]